MLALVSILVGVIFCGTGSLWLWYMLAQPRKWTRFTEKENAFWIERGFPIKWAGACKEFEQGRGLKVLVALCILVAMVLTITPFILLFLFPRHG